MLGKSAAAITASGGGIANFTRALQWFKPRYDAWLADPSQAITDADVLEAWPTMFDSTPSPAGLDSAGGPAGMMGHAASSAAPSLVVDRWGNTQEVCLAAAAASTAGRSTFTVPQVDHK